MLTGKCSIDPSSDLPSEAELLGAFAGIDLSGERAVVAAVSGGGDSLALLLLLHRHLREKALPARLLAVTVDHRLRPEAAAEARAVAEFCAARGIAHRTMAWEAGKPARGLQQAAREARYRLLAEAAAEAGAAAILTGHTLDDQLETVAMRGRRGAGRGLSGMAPAVLYDGRFWIVRPLLGVSRTRLRLFLRGDNISWHEDPSNADRRYERVRTRSMLADGGEAAPRLAGLLSEMRSAAAWRLDLGRRAARLIEAHATRVSPGLYRLAGGLADAGDRDAAVYALRILLAVAGGREHLVDEDRAAALLARLTASELRATLSRTVLERHGGEVYLRREMRGLPPAAARLPGRLWDGRYRLAAGAGTEAEVLPFGPLAAADHAPEDTTAPRRLVRAALAAEPALWRRGEWLGPAPYMPVVAPWARFLPCFDLAPAAAGAALAGGEPPPAPPLAPSYGG